MGSQRLPTESGVQELEGPSAHWRAGGRSLEPELTTESMGVGIRKPGHLCCKAADRCKGTEAWHSSMEAEGKGPFFLFYLIQAPCHWGGATHTQGSLPCPVTVLQPLQNCAEPIGWVLLTQANTWFSIRVMWRNFMGKGCSSLGSHLLFEV